VTAIFVHKKNTKKVQFVDNEDLDQVPDSLDENLLVEVRWMNKLKEILEQKKSLYTQTHQKYIQFYNNI
jgi:hypothetical protein